MDDNNLFCAWNKRTQKIFTFILYIDRYTRETIKKISGKRERNNGEYRFNVII